MKEIAYIAGIVTWLATMSTVGAVPAMILGIAVAVIGGQLIAQNEIRKIQSRVKGQQQNTNAQSQNPVMTKCAQTFDCNESEVVENIGNTQAQVMHGKSGSGATEIQKDHQKAMLFLKAANQGRASAQYHMGTLYIHGHGVPQDYVQAAEWLRKAAVQGVADAQLKLGLLYMHGHGLPQDCVQAAEWLRKAAVQGNASAQFNLGASYNNGQGAPQDYVQAAEWFRKAADQGNGDAQFGLGLLYLHGHGVPQDYILAMSWFHIALAHGFFNQAIIQIMPELNASFTPPQIAQAEKLAGEWFAAHH